MYYFIDGYNLLFNSIESKKTLQTQRQSLIQWLQKAFAKASLKGTVVFDGAHKRDEESGLSYPSPLEVAYTPKGQSADEYILELLSLEKNCKLSIVVTNDQGLKRHAQSMGAKTQSTDSFLQWVMKKQSKKLPAEKSIRETDFQIKRLTQIFEERLKKRSGDDVEGIE